MRFVKMQGTGNDFILLDGIAAALPVRDWAAESVRRCHRRFGVGADGLMLVTEREGRPVMTLYNSDGSVAAMCGNGIRCLCRFVVEKGYFPKGSLEVFTASGIRVVEPLGDGQRVDRVRVDLGVPELGGEKSLLLDGEPFRVYPASTGNPHAVTFVGDLDAFDFEKYGPLLEGHEAFPDRANAEFAQVLGPEEVRVKVWERGCGPTLACGTGGGAVAAVSMALGFVGDRVTEHLPGGDLIYEKRDGNIWMTGDAQFSFRGEWDD